MNVTKLEFEGFRNLKDGFIEPVNGMNIIYGDNAQGKTNLLEGIWIFNGSKSFRRAKDSEYINFSKDYARLKIDFFAFEREQNASLLFSGAKKEIKLNGVKKNNPSELSSGGLCSVIFSPENLTLVKDGPNYRRKFIDSAISQLKPGYNSILQKYNQSIDQRNALLRDIKFHPELIDTLSVWDEYIAKLGVRIILERLSYLDILSFTAGELYGGLSGGKERLTFNYDFSFENKDKNLSADDIYKKIIFSLEKNRQEDLNYKNTSVGPHRDDIGFFVDGVPARNYASQGQQRSIVIALKLAQAYILKDRSGEKPVILLDDVLSELDSFRQSFVLNKIDGWQVFITCCESASAERLNNGKVFNVKDGAFFPAF